MGRKEMQSLFSLITAAVFFTAAFFTGRQAAVLTGKFRVEREQSRQSQTKYCVVVDAGHGGDDPGKIGTAGTLEKEINLAIAKRLEALLKQADVAVVMTRTDSNGLYDENASGKKVQYSPEQLSRSGDQRGAGFLLYIECRGKAACKTPAGAPGKRT